ncbi:MAG: excalibur calcium-binding domain-containing protein [Xanthomonadales bacterium]|nr:excalibur calcium-binding domain-containing protein [Xanthomonadales bacterium]
MEKMSLQGSVRIGASLGADPVRRAAPVAIPAAGEFRCDGRTHCSQMRSCAEATYFLRNCLGTQMDGDGDGVPCERQWCG